MKPLTGLVWSLVCAAGASAQVAQTPLPDYARDVKPLLAQKCFACHGALRQESDLRLDAFGLIRKGGDSGAVVVPGKPGESLLLEKVSSDDADVRMPPEGEGERLDEQQLALVRRWIEAGALGPENEPVPPGPRDHWAYRTPVRPPVPQLDDPNWANNPIDVFLAAEHQRLGLSPSNEAERHILLRRVYLDLVGLPPTREERHAFLADDSPRAYENVVDRLLASPLYGERWGRHWMDVWRYSDWSGYRQEIRNSQRHIWHWRDWIVESLNEDRGYDRMVREMLAGDELAPTDPDTLRATGYLARNWYKFNRNFWLDQTVEHTAKAFLGMTINCARCHDHKYDPIAQANYYQLRAVFEPHNIRTDRVPGEFDIMQDGLPRAFDAEPEAETYLYVRGNEKQPVKDKPLSPGLPKIFGIELDIQPVELPVDVYYPALREFEVALLLAAERKKLETARRQRDDAVKACEAAEEQDAEQAKQDAALAEARFAAAEASLAALEARIAADRAKYLPDEGVNAPSLARAASAAELALAAAQAQGAVLEAERNVATARGNVKEDDSKTQDALAKVEKVLEAAQKNFAEATNAVEKPTEKYTPLGNEYPRTSTGRRLALARWVTDPRNPLTARVAANHIWLRHFGAPLVDNVFDFGLRSPKPRHAALLDWLAVELVESGWSMKHLHRLMVTSAAYRRASSTREANPRNVEIDPDNLRLWRMNTRRLEAEAVRDAALAVAGNLDLAQGGPDIDENSGQTSRRRSIYFRHAYEKKMKFLELFDVASENECYRRSESIVPQQALAMANSPLSLAQARFLARRLNDETNAASPSSEKLVGTESQPTRDETFIETAFAQILSRDPTADELTACREFLVEQTSLLSDRTKLTTFSGGQAAQVPPSANPALRARENLVHVLLNHNDFVTVR